MGLFGGNYSKPGPGIEKNAPKKRGLALFWDLYAGGFWDLIKLNLLFLLVSLPIVTIGPAYAALTKITMLMVREKPYFLWSDFWDAFRENWKQALPAGLLLAAAGGLLGLAAVVYGRNSAQNLLFFAALMLTMLLCLLVGLASLYLFPLLVTIDLPLGAQLKNAFLLGMICRKHSLPALAVLLVMTVAVAVTLPMSLSFVTVFYVSHVALISSFAAWPGLRRYVAGGQDPLPAPTEK